MCLVWSLPLSVFRFLVITGEKNFREGEPNVSTRLMKSIVQRPYSIQITFLLNNCMKTTISVCFFHDGAEA